jgi:hypothetical protein
MRMHAAALQLQRACGDDARTGRQAGMRGHISRHAHTYIYVVVASTTRHVRYCTCKPPTIWVCMYIYVQIVVQLLGLRFPSTLLGWPVPSPSTDISVPPRSLPPSLSKFFYPVCPWLLPGLSLFHAWRAMHWQ